MMGFIFVRSFAADVGFNVLSQFYWSDELEFCLFYFPKVHSHWIS